MVYINHYTENLKLKRTTKNGTFYKTFCMTQNMLQQHWSLYIHSMLYHEPAICTLEGSKGVPLKGDPLAFQAFFKISWAF